MDAKQTKKTVNKILDRKLELESRLANLISTELTKFKEDTGVSVKSINPDFISTYSMGEPLVEYIFTDLRVDLVDIDVPNR